MYTLKMILKDALILSAVIESTKSLYFKTASKTFKSGLSCWAYQ